MAGPRAADLIGMGWLYALHARSSIARGKFWQAEYMVSGVRDHALALACVRHGLSAVHGRGMDELPAEVAAGFEGALVGRLEARALSVGVCGGGRGTAAGGATRGRGARGAAGGRAAGDGGVDWG